MSANFLIRPVAINDYDQWLTLWNGYNTFYGRSGETALPEEITSLHGAVFLTQMNQ